MTESQEVAEEGQSETPLFDGLKSQWQKFVRHYLTHYNATKAYKQAGYEGGGASESGHRLLRNANIQAAIRELEEIDLRQWDSEGPRRLMQEYLRMAFADVADFYNKDGSIKSIHKMPKAARAALAEVTTDVSQVNIDGDEDGGHITVTVTKIKRWDKLKAMEAIAKRVNLWPDEEEDGDKDINLTVTFEEDAQVNGGE